MVDSPDYREILGSVEGLKRGFTSGTAAQAASLAAAIYLLDGVSPDRVTVTLKDGRKMGLPVVNSEAGESWAACGVIKDAGDDEDITHGAEFRARVTGRSAPGVHIVGGTGVGRVTRPGLPIPVGDAAINPNPRRCITEELERLMRSRKTLPTPGLEVTISIPDGRELARRTWNPRLGIEGGLSVIGTTGVVEPKSSTAYKASIVLAIKVLAASGTRTAALAFGYVGEKWFAENRSWGEDRVVKTGDHIGFAMGAAVDRGFGRIVIAGHVGKMTKVAAGLFDTHWSTGDARMETVAAWAAAAGADTATVSEILRMATAEESVALLHSRGYAAAWGMMNRRLLERCRLRFIKDGRTVPEMESILLDLAGMELARDEI